MTKSWWFRHSQPNHLSMTRHAHPSVQFHLTKSDPVCLLIFLPPNRPNEKAPRRGKHAVTCHTRLSVNSTSRKTILAVLFVFPKSLGLLGLKQSGARCGGQSKKFLPQKWKSDAPRKRRKRIIKEMFLPLPREFADRNRFLPSNSEFPVRRFLQV